MDQGVNFSGDALGDFAWSSNSNSVALIASSEEYGRGRCASSESVDWLPSLLSLIYTAIMSDRGLSIAHALELATTRLAKFHLGQNSSGSGRAAVLDRGRYFGGRSETFGCRRTRAGHRRGYQQRGLNDLGDRRRDS